MAISDLPMGNSKGAQYLETHRVKTMLTKSQFLALRRWSAKRGEPMCRTLQQLLAPALELLVESESN